MKHCFRAVSTLAVLTLLMASEAGADPVEPQCEVSITTPETHIQGSPWRFALAAMTVQNNKWISVTAPGQDELGRARCEAIPQGKKAFYVTSVHIPKTSTYLFEIVADDYARVRLVKDPGTSPFPDVNFAVTDSKSYLRHVLEDLPAGDYLVVVENLDPHLGNSGFAATLTETDGDVLMSTATSPWVGAVVDAGAPWHSML